MKHLEDAFKQPKTQQPKLSPQPFRQKTKAQYQKWTLDPDNIEKSPQQAKIKLAMVVQAQLKRKFLCEKYLQEETFRQLIKDLSSLFSHFTSELQKLSKIELIIQQISDTFQGEQKNYLKQFQSLLDAKIRRLKKKGKKSQLIEFDKLVTKQTHLKRKNQVYYINEDDKGIKYPTKLMKKQSQHNQSKKSFGTMNSGSNQNQSGGSGNNKSGSGSKSGQSKALAVLLANIDSQEQRKGNRNKQKQKQKYEFTSILSATVSIRNRNNNSRLSTVNTNTMEENKSHIVQLKNTNLQDEDKDQAFIFHYPKHKHKF